MKLTFLSTDTPFSAENFPKGAVLLVDKPLGWTSFDVVKKLRYHLCKLLNSKKLKVGHAGTLDPLATGLLIVCIGEYTKKIDEFQGMEKEYTGTITLGATTPSYDREKAVDATFPTEHLNDAYLQEVHKQFIGEIQQIPPMYSAVKVEGRPMYKNARTGETVELEPRSIRIGAFELSPLFPVPISDLELTNISTKHTPIMLHPNYADGVQTDFRVVCSKGTYIRSLVFDFGRACGSGAYLSTLRRTRIGDFWVKDAPDIENWLKWLNH